MQQWGDTVSLPLKLLTFKLMMLMCLTRPSRSADLASLFINKCQFKPEGVRFVPSGLSIQARQGKAHNDYLFASFPDDKQLCPVETVQRYLQLTNTLRKSKESSHLFIAIVKPHNPVAPCTIAYWLKKVLKLAGTISDILKAADWSIESVFRKFYYQPTHNPAYG